jgi:hypothetical protein
MYQRIAEYKLPEYRSLFCRPDCNLLYLSDGIGVFVYCVQTELVKIGEIKPSYFVQNLFFAGDKCIVAHSGCCSVYDLNLTSYEILQYSNVTGACKLGKFYYLVTDNKLIMTKDFRWYRFLYYVPNCKSIIGNSSSNELFLHIGQSIFSLSRTIAERGDLDSLYNNHVLMCDHFSISGKKIAYILNGKANIANLTKVTISSLGVFSVAVHSYQLPGNNYIYSFCHGDNIYTITQNSLLIWGAYGKKDITSGYS